MNTYTPNTAMCTCLEYNCVCAHVYAFLKYGNPRVSSSFSREGVELGNIKRTSALLPYMFLIF